MDSLQPIQNILVCPACRGEIHIENHVITCINCKQVYPIHENIPQFAVYESGEAALKDAAEISKTNYEQRYQDFEKARNYNLKYDRKPLKLLSTKREYQILQHLLGRQKHCAKCWRSPAAVAASALSW